ncbi:MAG: hypothetical protein HYU77_13055 [Betaproteobacteria bacterium]|nr:hypothetical protein [Betaproteobacteria bacterium]
MFRKRIVAAAVAAAVGMPLGVHAASDAELAQIRDELKRMKDAYETRIQALEKRLQAAEASAQKAEATAAKAETAARAPAPQSGEAAFNPGVSLILSGTYARLAEDPANFQITGFVPTGGEVGPGRRGASLGESELAIAANIDPRFRGYFTAALTPENEVEVEEAWFQTLTLGSGLTLKAGRFFSGIGYLNEQHAHAWDFVDQPLPYKAFLGRQLGDDGVQLKWVAPTDLFVEVGAEAGRGRAFPGSDREKNGFGLAAAFARLGGDAGASHAWRAGLSYVRTSPNDRRYDDVDSAGTEVANRFDGRSRLWIADFVWKWAPEGNATERNLKLHGEYFRRRESGTLTFDVDGASAFGTQVDRLSSAQSGWYLQGAYQFAPRWRVGLRHDRLDFGTVDIGHVANGTGGLTAADFPVLASHSPSRNTLMFDFSGTEFSRLRLQLGADKSRLGVTDRQVYLQYVMSLGAHGAHKF